MPLQVFYWDMPIGQAIAVASDIEAARSQVMSTLPLKDFARPELEEALRADPQILGDNPVAIVAWNQ